MGLRVVRADEPRRVALVGELDLATVETVLRTLCPLADGVADAGGNIVVDLSELTFMDATGLHALVGVARRIRGHATLVLNRPPQSVRRLLGLCDSLIDAEPALIVEPAEADGQR